MSRLLVLIFLLSAIPLFSQKISGIITDEEQNPLAAVLVFNLQTEQKAYTDFKGEFTIEASANNELRFIRQGYERNSIIIGSANFFSSVYISLIRTVAEIEEVKLNNVKLTGNLNIDSKNLTKVDKVANLQAAIGLPPPPEKPREKPSETVKNILLPLIGIPPIVDIQAIYNVVSGKAKRQKRLYKYEDLQENITWLRTRVDDEYFTKMGIPALKIPEFLQFSMGINPKINQGIKAKNLSQVLFALEETFPKYLNRQP